MDWPDGPQLQGIAAIIGALGVGGFVGVRGLRKQKAGVPATDAEIDKNLADDKRELLEDVDELRDLLAKEQGLRLRQAAIAESRRVQESRLYESKIADVVRQRNEAYETLARNRRRFIERYGEDNLGIFLQLPEPDETWTAAELRELRRLSDMEA